MSHYGYVPLAQAPLLVQPYALATPATWTFTRQMSADPLDLAPFGGVEDLAFTPAQRDELVALGGGWFASAEAFTLWLHQHS